MRFQTIHETIAYFVDLLWQRLHHNGLRIEARHLIMALQHTYWRINCQSWWVIVFLNVAPRLQLSELFQNLSNRIDLIWLLHFNP